MGFALKRMFKGRKALLEIALAASLLMLGYAAYHAVTRKSGDKEYSFLSGASRELYEGINHYRLDELAQAEVFFRKALEQTRSRDTKSAASLYLGNTYFKRGEYEAALSLYGASLSYDRRNINALYNSALASMQKGDISGALEYASSAIKLRRDFAPANLLCGNIYYAAGKYSKALYYYAGGSGADNPAGDPVFGFNEARAYLKTGQKEKAESIFARIAADPGSEAFVNGLSHLSLGFMSYGGDMQKAVSHFRSAHSFFPSSAQVRYNLAVLLLRSGEAHEAVKYLRGIERGAYGDEFDRLFGEALFLEGSYSEALDLYMGLYEKEKNPEFAAIAGDLNVKLGDFHRAASFYEKALGHVFKDEITGNLIQIYARGNSSERALAAGRDFIRGNESGTWAYLSLANLYFRMGEEKLALEHAERAVKNAGDDVSALLSAAALYRENGLTSSSLKLYHRVLALEDGSEKALSGISEIFLSTGHLDKAQKTLAKLRQSTENIRLYYDVSLLLASALSLKEAEALYRELIRDFPYRYEAYYNLALNLLKEEEHGEAAGLLERCIKNSSLFGAAEGGGEAEWSGSAKDGGSPEIFEPGRRAGSNVYALLGIARASLGSPEMAKKAFSLALELDGGNEIAVIYLRRIGD